MIEVATTSDVNSGGAKKSLGQSVRSVPVHRSVWTWFWVGLLAVGLPMLAIYFSRMWRMPHYQYFPFAVLAVVGLAWSRSDRRFYPPTTWVSLVCLGVGLAALGMGWALRSPWMVAIAFFFFAAGCLEVMRGERDRSLLALALPLALLVRLPLNYDLLLILELQPLTTKLSSLLLDVLGVPHAVANNVIELTSRELFVAEACSGIQSVFTLAFLSTLLIAVYRRRLWLTPLYLLIACVLAVAGNVLRVTTVAYVDHSSGWDWAVGWSHDLLGYATLGVAALFLVSFDHLVVAFLHPTGTAATESKTNPLIRLWNWCVDDGTTVDAVDAYFLAGAGAEGAAGSGAVSATRTSKATSWMRLLTGSKPLLIGTVGVMLVMFGVTTTRALSVKPMQFEEGGMGMFVEGLIFDPPTGVIESDAEEFSLAERETSRGGENPILGQNSDVWRYSTTTVGNGNLEGLFVLSQSYSSFHELCLCYQNQEWEILDRSTRPVERDESNAGPSGAGQSGAGQSEAGQSGMGENPVAYAAMRSVAGRRGHLWYAAVGASGSMPAPPARPGRLASRFVDSLDATPEAAEPIMMVQIWVTSDSSLTRSSVEKITADFALIRRRVAERVKGTEGEPASSESSESESRKLESNSEEGAVQ